MAKHTVPNLENATPSFLLDEIAKMRIEMSRLKFLDGVYKQAMEARADESSLKDGGIIEGASFIGTRKKMSQERISPDKVREYFAKHKLDLAEVTEELNFWQWNTSAKAVPDV